MKIIAINKDDGMLFDSEVMKQPAFVKFYAPWCGHCQQMAPEWDKMTKELNSECTGDALLMEVHHEALPQIKSDVKNIVQGFPTIVEVLPGGKLGEQYSGERTAGQMKEWFYKHFKKHGVKKKQSGGGKMRGRTCKRRRVRKNADGSYNKADIEHNQRCANKYTKRDNPWMKEVLKGKPKTEYDKFLKQLIKKNIHQRRKRTKRQRLKRKQNKRRTKRRSKRKLKRRN
jgi:thiol-disulfide isomerase/thioredoxin